MEVCTTITSLQSALQSAKINKTAHVSKMSSCVIGFVPTMGFLHEGHLSLVQQARAQCDLVVMSIFVNPLQFLPHEDYERYPRDHERDSRLAAQAGVDVLFLPNREEIYPRPTHTKIIVSGITEAGEGASRPGHFDGVATVVMKLFHIVQPDRAYFGTKDAQQVAVIEQMVVDMNLGVTIVPCPTWREADGLAMSSRNVYLTDAERKQAVVLSQALSQVQAYIAMTTNPQPEEMIRIATAHIHTAPLAQIDYIHVWGYPSFQPLAEHDERAVLALAVRFGKTRLIDNLLISLRRA